MFTVGRSSDVIASGVSIKASSAPATIAHMRSPLQAPAAMIGLITVGINLIADAYSRSLGISGAVS